MEQPSVIELKKIARDLLRGSASDALLNRVDGLLDAGGSDAVSLQEACSKIEKMVGLFIAQDKAQAIGRRFGESLAKAGPVKRYN